MSKKSIQKVYALTPMQEGMLYHAMLDPHSSSYFTQLELGIHGAFDLEIFEKSVNELIRSYDILLYGICASAAAKTASGRVSGTQNKGAL
ncbi:condensation domain-containing protein [Bacillus subtilis]|uniref:condensation domain-containing protein n=1 Tax=Bacillus subtilis TaxID=1423 RepID=UPI003C78CEC7